MDVKTLYANIPNNEGIAAVKQKHNNYPNKTIATKMITTFIFNSKFYLQIKGCVMGTVCTPTYANIFMSKSEEK